MAVYRPTYRDAKSGKLKQSAIWRYNFSFAGRRIQESSKSSRKTVAIEAEKNRRKELERGFNGLEDNRGEQLVAANVLGTELIRWFAEVLSKRPDGVQVQPDRGRGIMPDLEVFQHPLSKWCHRKTPFAVTTSQIDAQRVGSDPEPPLETDYF